MPSLCPAPTPIILNVKEAQILFLDFSVSLSAPKGHASSLIFTSSHPLPTFTCPKLGRHPPCGTTQSSSSGFSSTCFSMVSTWVMQGKAVSLQLLGPRSATLYLSHMGAAMAHDPRREWEPQVVSSTLPAGPALTVVPAEAEKATGRGCAPALIGCQAQKVTHWYPEVVGHQRLVSNFLAFRVAVKKTGGLESNSNERKHK